ncbi:hypothetical protein E1202_17685 [Saccharopolyspora karakumensis]|uniref:Polyketide cyclase / dehydrase and lipid transport n=1 Tax=Saccharopolyspora karakumensis TaxID=2530386 RepID=A0A4R5BNE6_9PSEU|nr:hypothetical protein [Saccharopolyspora karakumensis]TDD86916.1 hypothetical protein E1202_17685 [Saccharopolyspora karakumensis]
MTQEPVHLDDHHVLIHASRGQVWQAVLDQSEKILSRGKPIAWILGANPPNGFAVTAEEPHRRLDLSGRHRLATYLLRFELADPPEQEGSTVLVARSYADFHGLIGRGYRAALLASGGHVAAVRLMLRAVRTAATKR